MRRVFAGSALMAAVVAGAACAEEADLVDLAAGQPDERAETTTTERPTTTDSPTTTRPPTTTTVPPTTTTTAPPESPEVTNARRAAESYLEFSGFSRSGLIDQLEFEGYSTDAATTAVDSLNVDWAAQAVRSAEAYLEFQPFSHSGLVDQLEFEGFTAEEAEHGATVALGG